MTRIAQYHKDGVKLSEEYLEKVMQKATELGLPPHKQLGMFFLYTIFDYILKYFFI